jgi:hypothetical protein
LRDKCPLLPRDLCRCLERLRGLNYRLPKLPGSVDDESTYTFLIWLNCSLLIVSSARDVPYGDKHSLSMLLSAQREIEPRSTIEVARHSLSIIGEARTGARARASPSMITECLAPYGTTLAELTITQSTNSYLKWPIVEAK